MNDELLLEQKIIKQIKKNDNSSFDILVENYKNMIYKIIRSYSLRQGDYLIDEDELYQEGCIALYDACKTYSRINKCKFSSFAYVVIKRRINREVFKYIGIYNSEALSIDKLDANDKEMFFEDKYVEDNPIEYIKRENRKEDIEKALKNFNSVDQKIIRLRIDGYSYDEIGKLLKISAKRVDNRIQYIKKKKN